MINKVDNISIVSDCYGCGVCAIACNIKIIKIDYDKNGFYRPYVTETNKCTGCKACISVCAYLQDELSLKKDKISGYAAWNNNEQIRKICSSGGVGFELGQKLLSEGYKAVGVKYNTTTSKAEHYIAETIEQFIPSIGSKYIQSYTFHAFSQLNRKDSYFITGTPCQIDSLRRYIKKYKIENNFILMDFFCHGVPSIKMWEKYSKLMQKKIGKIDFVSWRNKQNGLPNLNPGVINPKTQNDDIGWHNSYNLFLNGNKTYINSNWFQGDLFYRMFLNDSCLSKACYDKCKYKGLNSSADIRVGDLWGESYKTDEKGVSGVLIFTDKGRKIIESLADTITLIEEDISVVVEGQMKSSPKKPKKYKITKILLKTSVPISVLYKIGYFYEKTSNIPNYILKIFKQKK